MTEILIVVACGTAFTGMLVGEVSPVGFCIVFAICAVAAEVKERER